MAVAPAPLQFAPGRARLRQSKRSAQEGRRGGNQAIHAGGLVFGKLIVAQTDRLSGINRRLGREGQRKPWHRRGAILPAHGGKSQRHGVVAKANRRVRRCKITVGFFRSIHLVRVEARQIRLRQMFDNAHLIEDDQPHAADRTQRSDDNPPALCEKTALPMSQLMAQCFCSHHYWNRGLPADRAFFNGCPAAQKCFAVSRPGRNLSLPSFALSVVYFYPNELKT